MRSRTSATPRSRTRSTFRTETLEPRTLLSGWSTVDTYPVPAGSLSRVTAMGSDSAGNVYAAGRMPLDSNGSSAMVREKANGTSTWTTIETGPYGAGFGAVVTDGQGDLFLSVLSNSSANITTVSPSVWNVLERPAGQTPFSVVDQLSGNAGCNSLAVDAAGDVFAAGQYMTSSVSKGTTVYQRHWIVRKWAPGTAGFVTVDNYLDPSGGDADPRSITVINSGTAAGIYAAGWTVASGTSEWLVRKSTDGGATWASVDTFTYTPSPSAPKVIDHAVGVSGDASGNSVYVVGDGMKEVISGYDKKGNPVYSSTYGHWIVRKSSTGAANSWTVTDDFQMGSSSAHATAVGTDPVGNMYVAGYANDVNNVGHAIVRSNLGGSWNTVNDYPLSGGSQGFLGFACDTAGNLYVGGSVAMPAGTSTVETWIVQSQPAAPSNLTAVADAVNPSLQIDLSWTNTAGADETGFGVYRSTDGLNFSLVGTVDANTTSYADTGLSAASTYYYRVVTLLNSDGSSAPSNTASAATAGSVATPAAAAAVFSSVQVSATTDLTDLWRHRKHRRV